MKRQLIIVLAILSVCCNLALAQPICPLENRPKPKEVPSLEVFKKIAILEDGRVKPMDTFAQNLLLRFSGKRSFGRQPAIKWLARLLFASTMTQKDKVFLINNPEIPMALGIEPDHKRLYSFDQIEPVYSILHELASSASQIEDKSRTIVEQEILRVASNIRLYADLSHNFEFAIPHPDFTLTDPAIKEKLNLPPDQDQFSYFDIAIRADLIKEITETIEPKGLTKMTPIEKGVFQLLANHYQWSMYYKDLPFHIFPALSKEQERWLSPWDAIHESFNQEITRKELSFLRDMTWAYYNGKQLEFDIACRVFSESVKSRTNIANQKAIKKIDLELLYNKLNLFLPVKLIYGFVFLLFLITLLSSKVIWYRLAFVLILVGFLLHAAALLMRIAILSRPPVTNLYETFIYVGLISVFLGIIMEVINRKWLGLVVASICGFVFLMIAGKYSAEGDTLQMLVAVLNSNFWLGTHVLSITTGYSGVCVAGILGHVYIIQALLKPKERQLLNSTYRTLIGVLGFGLTMTFLGTNLGGIWADQSWGRFWGWDPKENGALLIVLWCTIIFHARIGKMIGPLGVAVGCALGIIVVLWAWFGVNLLSVGLHSYGFTSGVATSLIAYVTGEMIFLLITVPIAKRKLSDTSS